MPTTTAHIAFVKMAHAFEQIDQEMLYEMEEDIKRCLQPSDELHPEAWSSSRFSDRKYTRIKGSKTSSRASHTHSQRQELSNI